MITFEYYATTYHGKLSENEFNEQKDKAILIYENYTLKPKLTQKLLDQEAQGAKAIRFALCEVIDNLAKYEEYKNLAIDTDKRVAQGIKSESVVSHNVTFSDKAVSSTIESDLNNANRNTFNKYLLRTGLLYRGL